MVKNVDPAEIPGLLKIQFERILKRMVELDVLLMKNPTPRGAIYGIAREINGHTSEMMRLCQIQVKAEIRAKLAEEARAASS